MCIGTLSVWEVPGLQGSRVHSYSFQNPGIDINRAIPVLLDTYFLAISTCPKGEAFYLIKGVVMEMGCQLALKLIVCKTALLREMVFPLTDCTEYDHQVSCCRLEIRWNSLYFFAPRMGSN